MSRSCPAHQVGHDLLTKQAMAYLVIRLQPAHQAGSLWPTQSEGRKWLTKKVMAYSVSRQRPFHQAGHGLLSEQIMAYSFIRPQPAHQAGHGLLSQQAVTCLGGLLTKWAVTSSVNRPRTH